MIDWHSVKVFSPGYQAVDWGFDYSQVVDLETALNQPRSIAAVPVFCNNPKEFSYKTEFHNLDLSKFDLVLFTDIQFRSQTELIGWIKTTGASNWLLSVAGLWGNESLADNVIYRPTWMFTFLQWNPPRDDFPLQREFLFDCLCGTRRRHRDYAMLSLIQTGLIDQGIVTYRDIFPGQEFNKTPWEIQQHFRDIELPWPYVSSNLKPEWEVRDKLDNSISSCVPWDIYNRTYFTMLMETIGGGNIFLAAEKIAKCLHARRLFVHFGVSNWLRQIKNMGFETFASVIDENYDSIPDDIQRWRAAFDQVQQLSKQNMPAILTKIKPILDHNHNRLYQYRQEISDAMRQMIQSHLN